MQLTSWRRYSHPGIGLFFFVLILSCARTERFHLDVYTLKLDNGLTALLVRREGAPVFSSYVRIKVGNIEEPRGSSGLAHFFEHMAFKGTDRIGTRDYAAEKVVIEKMRVIGEEIVDREEKKAPPDVIARLKAELKNLQAEQAKLIEPNEFVRIYQRNGGGDLNATTSNDFTNYFVSLPSNKIHLWAYLESERLKNLVLREFFKERDVVIEERRMRYENDPDGKLYEAFMREAFTVSPYGINVIGWPEEIGHLTPTKAESFFQSNYFPSRIVLALVGNFDLNEAEAAIRENFGSIPGNKGQAPAEAKNPEEPPPFPREKTVKESVEPRFYMGFHRPSYPHPDDEVFDMIEVILCEGRTSRLYSTLVEKKKLATAVDCYASLPGSRLNGLFSFYALPIKPHGNRVVLEEIKAQLDRLKTERVGPVELEKTRNHIEAELIWAMKTNKGLAGWLTYFQSLTGDWKYIYRLQNRIREISAEDIRRVAVTYFVPEKEVTVLMERGAP